MISYLFIYLYLFTFLFTDSYYPLFLCCDVQPVGGLYVFSSGVCFLNILVTFWAWNQIVNNKDLKIIEAWILTIKPINYQDYREKSLRCHSLYPEWCWSYGMQPQLNWACSHSSLLREFHLVSEMSWVWFLLEPRNNPCSIHDSRLYGKLQYFNESIVS